MDREFLGTNSGVIRSQLAGVVGNTGYSNSEMWEVQRLNSKPGIEPRTYDAWESFPGLKTAEVAQESYDNDRKCYVIVSTARLRISELDPEIPLKIGDQVRSVVDHIVWAIFPGMVSSGLGTKAYGLQRTAGTIAGAERKGGV